MPAMMTSRISLRLCLLDSSLGTALAAAVMASVGSVACQAGCRPIVSENRPGLSSANRHKPETPFGLRLVESESNCESLEGSLICNQIKIRWLGQQFDCWWATICFLEFPERGLPAGQPEELTVYLMNEAVTR